MDKIRYKRLIEKIKDFLFSKKNREFLIFLFFLFTSFVFWMLRALNETYETEITIPLKLKNVPSDLIITTGLPEKIRVTLKDKGSVLIKYIYGQTFSPVWVDYNDYEASGNAGRVVIQEADVQKKIMLQLLSSTRIVSLRPSLPEFYYNRGMKKTVPIILSGRVKTASQYYLEGVHYTPDSAIVYASNSILDTLTAIYTTPVNLKGISANTTMQVMLSPIRGAKFIPETVKVALKVDMYTEKTVEVPIVGINFPATKDLRTFPSKANITFRVGMNHFKAITAEDFALVITYEDLLKNQQSKYRLNLKSIPEGISQVRIIPHEVDYLIEQTAEEE